MPLCMAYYILQISTAALMSGAHPKRAIFHDEKHKLINIKQFYYLHVLLKMLYPSMMIDMMMKTEWINDN